MQSTRTLFQVQLTRQFRVDFSVQILHPAIVVLVNLAILLVQIDAAPVNNAVFCFRIGNINNGGVFAQMQRALNHAGTSLGHLPAERHAGIDDCRFNPRGCHRA